MNLRLFAVLMMMTIVAGCAKPSIIVQEFKAEQIIHYRQMKDVENLSDYVVYLNKGEKIPVKMTLDSEILDLSNEEIELVLKQKVYFRLSMPEGMHAEKKMTMSEAEKQKFLKEIMIYLSLDAIKWAPYTDIKAVEQLFGIKGGSVSFGMGITKEDGLRIFLNLKTNRL
jgi:t-SNARE complex subunit (syntaxin)